MKLIVFTRRLICRFLTQPEELPAGYFDQQPDHPPKPIDRFGVRTYHNRIQLYL